MTPEQLRNQILVADVAWIPAALAAEQALSLTLQLRWPLLAPTNFVIYGVCTVVAWILLSENMHLDGFRGGWRLSALVCHLLLAVGLLMIILLAVEDVWERYLGALTLSVFSLFLGIGFLCIRGVALRVLRRRCRRGEVSRILIIGSDTLANELAAKFSRHPELLCQVIGFLCPEAELATADTFPPTTPKTVSTIEVIGLLRQHKVDELILARTPASNEILNLVALCRQQSIRVSLVPQPYELYLSRPNLLDIGGLPLLRLGDLAAPASTRLGKRAMDLILSLILGVIALPVIMICGTILRFSSGRAFRWEQRTGRRGAQFAMLRLNVPHDATSESQFERLLWQLSLSELPQFWNVLRGDMSLVGPRPECPQRSGRYSTWQQQRLSVNAGMTGLAQIHGLRHQHASEDKTRYDLQYMLHPSLLKDMSLLVETIWILFFRLFKVRKPTLGSDGLTPRIVPLQVLYSPSTHSFPEMLQHAHRTQSGSD